MITSTLKDPLRVSQTPAMLNYLISLASTMVDNPSNSPHLEEEKNVRGPSLRPEAQSNTLWVHFIRAVQIGGQSSSQVAVN